MTDLSGSGRSDRFAIRGDCCIEERIWGRRLYDEQSGVISLLELLCVFNAAPSPPEVRTRRQRPHAGCTTTRSRSAPP